MVGDVDGIGCAVGDGDGHGFSGSSGKHGVGTGVAVGATVGDAVGETVGVGVWLTFRAAEADEKLDAIPTAFNKRQKPINPKNANFSIDQPSTRQH
jgi:hypothetical protein